MRARRSVVSSAVIATAVTWLGSPSALLAQTAGATTERAVAAPGIPAPVAPSPDEPPPLTIAELRRGLAAKPTGPALATLVDKLRRWFGADAIKAGMGAKVDGADAVFAIEAPAAKAVAVRSVDGLVRLPLEPLAGSELWLRIETFGDGTALRFAYDVDGRRLGAADVETFSPLPDHLPQAGVPRGKVIPQKRWKSAVFAGTERDWWIYVPAQARSGRPVGVVVFQDGGNHFVKPVPAVLDNLIHKGEIPPTAAVFINPGVFADGRRNRAVEYETMSADYARFITDEILPEVEKTVKLRKDPQSRAIAGMSSGALCAFTAAWHKPDQFGKVLSWVGTYTNVGPTAATSESGHDYPALVRRGPRRPVRIFLQAGQQDLEQEAGSWALGNAQMERALIHARWDFRMVWGHGFHSTKHGLAVLPEALRWLYRDHNATTPRSN